MKYKFKIGQVINFDNILKNIIENEKEVNVVFKFRLLGIRKAFGSIISNVDVIRNDLVVKYGKKDDNEQFIIKPDDKENFEQFVSEMNKFLDTETEVDFEKIDMSEAFNGGLKNSDYLVNIYDIMQTKE